MHQRHPEPSQLKLCRSSLERRPPHLLPRWRFEQGRDRSPPGRCPIFTGFAKARIRPCGTEEIDLKIETGEALALFQAGGMRGPDGRIGDVAPHSAVYGPHRICMGFSIGHKFHRCRADANFYESET